MGQAGKTCQKLTNVYSNAYNILDSYSVLFISYIFYEYFENTKSNRLLGRPNLTHLVWTCKQNHKSVDLNPMCIVAQRFLSTSLLTFI